MFVICIYKDDNSGNSSKHDNDKEMMIMDNNGNDDRTDNNNKSKNKTRRMRIKLSNAVQSMWLIYNRLDYVHMTSDLSRDGMYSTANQYMMIYKGDT